MTNTEKLQQLTEAIIELVPEIKDLKFGCKVMGIDGIESICLGMDMVQQHIFFWNETLGICTNIKDEHIDKITGRDITLADVLLAINRIPQMCLKFDVWTDGTLLAEWDDRDVDDLPKWDLTKPLHLQEQETINFLHDVICQEK